MDRRSVEISVASVLALALVAVMLVRSGRFVTAPVVEAVADNCYSDTLHVITDEDYRPYSFYDANGNFSGHDVELITMVANELQMNLDLKFMSWDDGIAATLAGEAQVLMTCDYSDSFAGTEKLLKSEPMSTDDFTVFSKKRITSVNELYGMRIGVMAYGNAISHLEVLNLMSHCVQFSDNREAMLALMDDRVDCIVVRNAVGTVLMRELKTAGIRGYITIGQSYMCFGVNSGCPELAARINVALEKFKTDGQMKALNDKWLTTFVAPYTVGETIESNLWLFIGFVLIFVLLLFVLYLQDRRKRESEESRKRYMQIVDNLANDFECVNYIPLVPDKSADNADLIRISDTLKKALPEWGTELNFSKRLDIMSEGIVAPEDRDDFVASTRREVVVAAIDGGDPYFVNFKAIIDGAPQFFQLKFSSVCNEAGELTGVVCGVHNIDEQTKAEIRAREQLVAANKSKTDFLFNMSHDIRTPMNAIIGFTDLARKNIDDPQRVQDCLSKIELSGGHLLDIINDVLDMSRVEAGKLKSHMKTVSVLESARKLVTICQETAAARNIVLTFEDAGIVHHTVSADELHVNQVLMNILGNAIKYTLPGGSVSFSVNELQSDHPGYGRYLFKIKDTGIGMSNEFLSKVFDSFSREETETVSGIEGTGLGMSIVKRLVDYMDGTVSIESQQGRGTDVSVVLPLQIISDDNAQILSDADVLADLNGKRVLLVEDNELNREIATFILQSKGLDVESAANGIEAVETIKSKGPDCFDCVLMDIQMPLMNGYEATSAIRKLPGADKLVIIALSANAFEEDRQQSIDAGMNDHIAKPINPDELSATLAKYLR